MNLVLWGMGNMGRSCLRELKSKGIRVAAVTDNNPALWGKVIEGEFVFEPRQAVKLFPEAMYVVTISGKFSEVRQQLEAAGIINVTSAGRLSRDHHLTLLPCPFETAEFYANHAEEIARLRELLADEESRIELDQQIEWRKTLDDAVLSPHLPASEIYFPGFIAHEHDEVFVDCGAYDGDTVQAFEIWACWLYRSIFAFEPIMQVRGEATVIPCAVGERSTFTTFADKGAGSTRGEGVPVQIVALDDVFKEVQPTFIKMDLESMEPEALRGAKRILKEAKPVLAVCLYHRPAHLWELPLLVHELQPDYKLFLRRYADECWETILYCVPEGRLK